MITRALCGTLGLAIALSVGTACAEALRVDRLGPFTQLSDGASENSSTPYSASVRTDGELRVVFHASHAHCSPIRVSISVDNGPALTSLAIAPGQDSLPFELSPQGAGVHELKVNGEGIPGGCNAGQLRSWGGTLTVWTSGPEAGALTDSAALGDLVFALEQIGYGRGGNDVCDYIDATGTVHRLAKSRRNQPAADDGYYGADWLISLLAGGLTAGHLAPETLAPFHTAALSLAAQSPTPASNQEPTGRRWTTAVMVFVWDVSRGAYRRILLAERGQKLWSSPAPPHWDEGSKQAAELSTWLLHFDDGVRDR